MRRLRDAVVVAVVMMILFGCGHQVTGLTQPGGGNAVVAPGETLLRFETVAPPDFTNVTYLIVVNATGDGQVPTAQGQNSNYREWSFAFYVGGGPGFVNVPDVEQYYLDPSNSGGVNHRRIIPPTGTLTFSLLNSGNTNGFDIRFNRCIVDFPSPVNPNPGTPTPPPSPHPVGQGCPPYFYVPSTTWTINIFTVDSTITAQDSLGNGPGDTSYPGFTFDTSQAIPDQAYLKPAGGLRPVNAAAQIAGIEAFSQPAIATPTPVGTATPTPTPTPTATP